MEQSPQVDLALDRGFHLTYNSPCSPYFGDRTISAAPAASANLSHARGIGWLHLPSLLFFQRLCMLHVHADKVVTSIKTTMTAAMMANFPAPRGGVERPVGMIFFFSNLPVVNSEFFALFQPRFLRFRSNR